MKTEVVTYRWSKSSMAHGIEVIRGLGGMLLSFQNMIHSPGIMFSLSVFLITLLFFLFSWQSWLAISLCLVFSFLWLSEFFSRDFWWILYFSFSTVSPEMSATNCWPVLVFHFLVVRPQSSFWIWSQAGLLTRTAYSSDSLSGSGMQLSGSPMRGRILKWW